MSISKDVIDKRRPPIRDSLKKAIVVDFMKYADREMWRVIFGLPPYDKCWNFIPIRFARVD